MKTNAIEIFLTLVVAISAVGQGAAPRSSGGVSGVVRYPDGTPNEGATVSALTECKEMGYNRVYEVKTLADGSFYIPPFLDSTCSRVRLTAARAEDLWLKTGHDVFYPKDNGTTPLVEASLSGPPTVTEITLENRGALVSFRVRDSSSGRFIRAELYLERTPVPGATFASMLIATGRDGSPDILLLPAGQYEIFVQQYACREKDYFTASPPRETFTVETGEKIAKDIPVDVRLIKPMRSYSNPRARPCKP